MATNKKAKKAEQVPEEVTEAAFVLDPLSPHPQWNGEKYVMAWDPKS